MIYSTSPGQAADALHLGAFRPLNIYIPQIACPFLYSHKIIPLLFLHTTILYYMLILLVYTILSTLLINQMLLGLHVLIPLMIQ